MSVLSTVVRLTKRYSLLTSNILISKRYYATKKWVAMYLEDTKGLKHQISGEVGDSLLHAVRDTLQTPDYGVCLGTPGCTTCHVIFKPEDYKKMTPPDQLEMDLLERTVALTPSSRLGCQVVVEECMQGMELKLPAVTQDNRCI